MLAISIAQMLTTVAGAVNACQGEDVPQILVSVDNSPPQMFDSTALAKLPQRKVRAEAHGKGVSCEGPALIDVLAAASAPEAEKFWGDKLRGKNLALYVRIGAADGYRAVFALAELDPGFRDDVAIVTTRCDGALLDVKDGPFRLVVPGDKRPARWVRQVTTIDLLRAP